MEEQSALWDISLLKFMNADANVSLTNHKNMKNRSETVTTVKEHGMHA